MQRHLLVDRQQDRFLLGGEALATADGRDHLVGIDDRGVLGQPGRPEQPSPLVLGQSERLGDGEQAVPTGPGASGAAFEHPDVAGGHAGRFGELGLGDASALAEFPEYDGQLLTFGAHSSPRYVAQDVESMVSGSARVARQVPPPVGSPAVAGTVEAAVETGASRPGTDRTDTQGE